MKNELTIIYKPMVRFTNNINVTDLKTKANFFIISQSDSFLFRQS